MIHHDRVRAPYILCHVSMKHTVGLGVSGHAPGGKTAIFITPLIFQDTMRTLISLSGQRLYQPLVSTKKILEAMVLPPAQVGLCFSWSRCVSEVLTNLHCNMFAV